MLEVESVARSFHIHRRYLIHIYIYIYINNKIDGT